MTFVGTIWSLLSQVEKQRVIALFFLMLIGMGLEMLGIGLMVPFIASFSGDTQSSTILPSFFEEITMVQTVVIIAGIYLFKNVILAFILWFQNGFLASLKAGYHSNYFAHI